MLYRWISDSSYDSGPLGCTHPLLLCYKTRSSKQRQDWEFSLALGKFCSASGEGKLQIHTESEKKNALFSTPHPTTWLHTPNQAHKNVEKYYYPLSTTSPSHFAHIVPCLSPLSNHGYCSHHRSLKNFCNPAIRLKLKPGLSKGRKGICWMSWKKDSL